MTGTSATTPSLRRRVAVGATLMILSRLSFRTIGLLSTLVLVRLLLPSDFGLVGLVTLAYSAFDTISQLSFQLALIRMESPKRAHYDTAWTMGVIRGAAIAFLVVITAPLLASFVGEPRVVPLSYVLACLGFIGGFENVALVDFQRNLQFDRIFWYQVAGKLAGVFTAVPAALWLHNYWALVWGISASRVATLCLSYVMRPYRPRISLAGWNDLFNFSKWLMITNLLSVLDNYCMTLTVGRIAGSTAIGIYQVGYEIGALPASEVAAPIRDPIYAGYSRIADNFVLLRKHFLSNLSLLIAVITPMSLGICVMANPITTLLLGQKWLAAIPIIQLIAIFALFEAIGHSAGSLYMALHRQRRFVELYALIVVVRIPSIVIGAYLGGIFGATVALTLTAVLNMILWNAGVPEELNCKIGDFWSISWRTILASIAMVPTAYVLMAAWPNADGVPAAVARIVTICLVSAVVHVFVQYAAWRWCGRPAATAEAEALQLAQTFVRRAVRLIGR